MNIAVIGACGKAGKLILNEAMDRGHQVTAIVRDASKLAVKNITIIEKNIFDLNTEDLHKFDVIVNAFGAPLGEEQAHVDAGHHLIKLLHETNARLIVVGGAGSLYADENKTIRIIDTPDFPDVFKPTANGQARNLKELQETDKLAWTFVSPSAIFDAEGERTGSYKTGKDVLLLNEAGQSYISYADFAIAIVDEMEDAKHVNERFTVVSE